MTAVNTRAGLYVVAVMLSVGQLSAAEYHYKLRGPPRHPMPPLPPQLSIHRPLKHHANFYNNKLVAGPRIISSSLRAPPAFVFDHHPHLGQRYHGLPHSTNNVHVGRPAIHKHQPLLLSNGGGGALFSEPVRSPAVKEHFSLPLNNFEFYTTAKPIHTDIQYHHLAVDDDKGPIHTIPAPNLSLLDRPHNSLTAFPSSSGDDGFSGHGVQSSLHLQETHNVLPAHSVPVPQQPSIGSPQVSLGTYGGSGVTIQPSISYQVREETNDHAGQTLGGKPIYFAPDPDPNLPAPKTPLTSDPHSVPSNGRSPVELLVQHFQSQGTPLQLFETNTNVMHDGQSLSSQDLYRLLQGTLPQQQQLLDTYPLPILQQPQLQQHILQQQVAGYPTLYQYQQNGEVADNSLALRNPAEDFRPQLHTFNYEERAPDQQVYSSQPHYSSQLLGHVGDDEGAESAPELKFVRNTLETSSGALDERSNVHSSGDAHRGGPEAVNEVEGANENNFQPGKDNSVNSNFYSKVAQGSQLYTTLPNREAAETLATLAAAGNLNSNFINRLNGGGSAGEDNAPEEGSEEYSQEEEEEEEEQDDDDGGQDDVEYDTQPSSTSAPLTTTTPGRRLPQTYLQHTQQQQQRQRYQPTRGQLAGYYQVRHEESQRVHEEAEESFNEDLADGNDPAAHLQFGARIRPKRDDGSGD